LLPVLRTLPVSALSPLWLLPLRQIFRSATVRHWAGDGILRRLFAHRDNIYQSLYVRRRLRLICWCCCRLLLIIDAMMLVYSAAASSHVFCCFAVQSSVLLAQTVYVHVTKSRMRVTKNRTGLGTVHCSSVNSGLAAPLRHM